jgi:hypothetical protein
MVMALAKRTSSNSELKPIEGPSVSLPERIPTTSGFREPTPEEQHWARVHIRGDKAKALPGWFGMRKG